MTTNQAIKYVKMRFTHESELRSYAQDETDNGVFTLQQFLTFDDETKIDVAEDLQYELKQEFGYLF
jgi:hypothetical protein